MELIINMKDCHGFSPEQMFVMNNYPFDGLCPVQIRKLLQNENALMRHVLYWLFADYNVAWLDACDDERPGNIGRIYSLWLLHKFGGEWQHSSFYTAEYTKAFPVFDNYDSYTHRIFNRLFRLIGICETGDRPEFKANSWGHYIRKTDLLEMMFSFVEPR